MKSIEKDLKSITDRVEKDLQQNRPISIYQNSYLAPRLGGIKQKKCVTY